MIGTILWFDKRDGYGIATDAQGNEHYIDSSVIDRPELCRDNIQVTFEARMVGTCLCGYNVVVDVESAYDRQLVTVRALEAHGPEGLREGALDEAEATLLSIGLLLDDEAV